MLVFSRNDSEEIMINDDIRITIVEARSGKVCIGITAPMKHKVHRLEVYEAIHGAPAIDVNSPIPFDLGGES